MLLGSFYFLLGSFFPSAGSGHRFLLGSFNFLLGSFYFLLSSFNFLLGSFNFNPSAPQTPGRGFPTHMTIKSNKRKKNVILNPLRESYL